MRRRGGSAGVGLVLVLLASGGEAADATYEDKEVAVLQGLDKITARVSSFEAPVGETVEFGTLEITVEACKKRPPMEPPESAAFLDVVDNRVGGESVALFSGWMFASSPGLSPLEHPVYDVWVLDCE